MLLFGFFLLGYKDIYLYSKSPNKKVLTASQGYYKKPCRVFVLESDHGSREKSTLLYLAFNGVLSRQWVFIPLYPIKGVKGR